MPAKRSMRSNQLGSVITKRLILRAYRAANSLERSVKTNVGRPTTTFLDLNLTILARFSKLDVAKRI